MRPKASEWFGAALLLLILVGLCAALVMLAVSEKAAALVPVLS